MRADLHRDAVWRMAARGGATAEDLVLADARERWPAGGPAVAELSVVVDAQEPVDHAPRRTLAAVLARAIWSDMGRNPAPGPGERVRFDASGGVLPGTRSAPLSAELPAGRGKVVRVEKDDAGDAFLVQIHEIDSGTVPSHVSHAWYGRESLRLLPPVEYELVDEKPFGVVEYSARLGVHRGELGARVWHHFMAGLVLESELLHRLVQLGRGERVYLTSGIRPALRLRGGLRSYRDLTPSDIEAARRTALDDIARGFRKGTADAPLAAASIARAYAEWASTACSTCRLAPRPCSSMVLDSTCSCSRLDCDLCLDCGAAVAAWGSCSPGRCPLCAHDIRARAPS